MALVSTASAEASEPNIPPSVIFMTSSAILMNEMHEWTEAPLLGHTSHTSDAKVLLAELRPSHYILMVGTVHCTVPLLSLSFNQIEEHLSFDEENFSVSMTSDIDGAGPFNILRPASFCFKSKSGSTVGFEIEPSRHTHRLQWIEVSA
ncbi:hypothetical protein BDN71DRAFT_1514652 [Pleurotus eryngii]|uniref:Uncharacterized protein n=1 Tax=Pleurotus eryngii TaxID=5323 RepID=A0A9P6D7L2_PLEER|nr:hypothetical protein BDN71DRAFT_1514673 [Pleurotus eryngii]KAF9486773.1 hypothetical protein BDN71DRAFT_1514652 [Pleurotus eryngii]